MTNEARRHFVKTGLTALVATGIADGAEVEQKPMQSAQPTIEEHQIRPLPFDPKSLHRLSERLVVSHWENNSGGAVKALNVVRRKLADALSSSDPPYLYNDMKREHLIRTGSVVLHELYFGNLGGDGKPAAETRAALARAFGSYDTWLNEFVRIGQGLGGGSGWVVLGRNEHLGRLENYWLADHASNPPFTTPILVMDMYEHAYHLDYGAAAAKYIDAFLTNVQWDVVEQRMTSHKR